MGNLLTEQWKNIFRQATVLYRLLIVNIAIFLLINICRLVLFLFRADDEWLTFIINGLSVPSSMTSLLLQPWSLFTYMFVHVDFMHILFNMLVLFWTGTLFIEYLGGKKFFSTFFLGGLSGGLFYILAYNVFPAFHDIVIYSRLIGASAGVLAVLTAIATLLPEYRVQLLIFGTVKLKYIAIFSILLYAISIPQGNAGGQFAHLGGAFFGFIYIRQLRKGRDLASWFDKITALFTSGSSSRRKMKVTVKRSVSDEEFRSRMKSREEMIDQILDKISQSGYDSLSKEEKEVLFNASKNKNP